MKTRKTRGAAPVTDQPFLVIYLYLYHPHLFTAEKFQGIAATLPAWVIEPFNRLDARAIKATSLCLYSANFKTG